MSGDVILADLDGTLFDVSHRLHLAKQKRWDEFHEAMLGDSVNEDVANFLSTAVGVGMTVIAVTGRNEHYRQSTLDQLKRNGLSMAISELLMRPDGDLRSDAILKVEAVDIYFGGRTKALSRVAFALDDRDRVVEGYRDAGFRCWQVRKGQY